MGTDSPDASADLRSITVSKFLGRWIHAVHDLTASEASGAVMYPTFEYGRFDRRP
jgi:hypothetical protein